MKTNKTARKAGFTLVEIMIVVAIIGLLAAIAIPNFVKARATSQQNACINNLRQIDGAVSEWALETGQSNGAVTVFRQYWYCFGLHQAEFRQQRSGLPGGRHLHHEHRGCHAGK
jgi:prepilin-type N-terminal cleavage/methylation domain-containing protein